LVKFKKENADVIATYRIVDDGIVIFSRGVCGDLGLNEFTDSIACM